MPKSSLEIRHSAKTPVEFVAQLKNSAVRLVSHGENPQMEKNSWLVSVQAVPSDVYNQEYILQASHPLSRNVCVALIRAGIFTEPQRAIIVDKQTDGRYQNLGISTALFQALAEVLKLDGICTTEDLVCVDNTASQKSFENAVNIWTGAPYKSTIRFTDTPEEIVVVNTLVD